MSNINYLAVILATCSSMVLGFLWYAPFLFGTYWMKKVGIDPENASKEGMAKSFSISLISSLIAALVLELFMANIFPTCRTPLTGLLLGGGIGLLFVTPAFVTLGSYEKRSIGLSLVNGGYYVVSLAVAGLILGACK